jgi:hypothetical protein
LHEGDGVGPEEGALLKLGLHEGDEEGFVEGNNGVGPEQDTQLASSKSQQMAPTSDLKEEHCSD